MTRLLILSSFLIAAAGTALAGVGPAAPEVDASTGVAALTLISGAVLVLRSRKRK